jgi:hypothetical protein
MALNHLNLLAVVNPANPTERVVLSNIMSGVNGSATMYYTHERDGDIEVEARDTILTRINHNIEAQVLWSDAAVTQLVAWRNAQTPLIFAGYGIDIGLVWSVPATLAQTQQFDNIHSAGVRATLASLPGYISGKKAVQVGENLLGLWAVNTTTGNTLTGFKVVSGGVTSTGGVVTVDGVTDLSQKIYFPFAGQSLTFGCDVTGASGDLLVSLESYDETDTLISSGTVTLSGTGVGSSSFVLPAGTVTINYKLSTDGGDIVAARNPFVRIVGTRFTLE